MYGLLGPNGAGKTTTIRVLVVMVVGIVMGFRPEAGPLGVVLAVAMRMYYSER